MVDAMGASIGLRGFDAMLAVRAALDDHRTRRRLIQIDESQTGTGP